MTTQKTKETEEDNADFWQGSSNAYYRWNKAIDKRIEEIEKTSGIIELKRLKKEMSK